jgi:hypothetical protein
MALDEHGKPQAARVVTSPSPLVNDTSLMAAMRSEFTPAIFRCRPVSGGYIYNVDYTS